MLSLSVTVSALFSPFSHFHSYCLTKTIFDKGAKVSEVLSSQKPHENSLSKRSLRESLRYGLASY